MDDCKALPLSYFGNIALYHHIYTTPEIIFSGNEKYPKQTNRTRTKIMVANGLLSLTVPVIRPNGKDSLSKEIRISYVENWQKEHLKSIESAYRNAPYFIYFIDGIEALLSKKYEFLIDLNRASIQHLINKLGLSSNAKFTNDCTRFRDLDEIMLPKAESNFNVKRYIQAFEERHGFVSNLSILDLLFNEGPNAITILQESGN